MSGAGAPILAKAREILGVLEAVVVDAVENFEREISAATTKAETASASAKEAIDALAREKAAVEAERAAAAEVRAHLADALRKNSILMQREEHMRKFLLGPALSQAAAEFDEGGMPSLANAESPPHPGSESVSSDMHISDRRPESNNRAAATSQRASVGGVGSKRSADAAGMVSTNLAVPAAVSRVSSAVKAVTAPKSFLPTPKAAGSASSRRAISQTSAAADASAMRLESGRAEPEAAVESAPVASDVKAFAAMTAVRGPQEPEETDAAAAPVKEEADVEPQLAAAAEAAEARGEADRAEAASSPPSDLPFSRIPSALPPTAPPQLPPLAAAAAKATFSTGGAPPSTAGGRRGGRSETPASGALAASPVTQLRRAPSAEAAGAAAAVAVPNEAGWQRARALLPPTLAAALEEAALGSISDRDGSGAAHVGFLLAWPLAAARLAAGTGAAFNREAEARARRDDSSLLPGAADRIILLGRCSAHATPVLLGRDFEGKEHGGFGPKTFMTDAKLSRKALAVQMLADGRAKIKTLGLNGVYVVGAEDVHAAAVNNAAFPLGDHVPTDKEHIVASGDSIIFCKHSTKDADYSAAEPHVAKDGYEWLFLTRSMHDVLAVAVPDAAVE